MTASQDPQKGLLVSFQNLSDHAIDEAVRDFSVIESQTVDPVTVLIKKEEDATDE